MIILITTLHKKQDAARIGKGLLEKRLIACYNLWPIESAYWWKGEIIEQNEVMMIMKSTIRWFDDIVEYVKTESGYEVPELIALDSEKIDPSYQNGLMKKFASQVL
jgi:periplasmic divalent cation tolerance protein